MISLCDVSDCHYFACAFAHMGIDCANHFRRQVLFVGVNLVPLTSTYLLRVFKYFRVSELSAACISQ